MKEPTQEGTTTEWATIRLQSGLRNHVKWTLGPAVCKEGRSSCLPPPFITGPSEEVTQPRPLQDAEFSSASHTGTSEGQACSPEARGTREWAGWGRCPVHRNCVRCGQTWTPNGGWNHRQVRQGHWTPASEGTTCPLEFRSHISNNNNGCRNNSAVRHAVLATQDKYPAGSTYTCIRQSISASAD